jgi:hypothetical protein
MKEQQNSIDEFFRESLGDYREAPPAAAWDQVAGRLDSEGGQRSFLRWPWVVLSLLLIVGSVWVVAGLDTFKADKSDQYTSTEPGNSIHSTSYSPTPQDRPDTRQLQAATSKDQITGADQPLNNPIKTQDVAPSIGQDESAGPAVVSNSEGSVAPALSEQTDNSVMAAVQQERIVTEAASLIAAAPVKLNIAHAGTTAPSVVAKQIPASVVASLTSELEPATITESPSKAVSVQAANLATALAPAQQEVRPFVPRNPREVQALSATQQKTISQVATVQAPGQLTPNANPIPEISVPASPFVAAAEKVIAQTQAIPQRNSDPIDPLNGSSRKLVSPASSVNVPGVLVADNRPIRETRIAAATQREDATGPVSSFGAKQSPNAAPPKTAAVVPASATTAITSAASTTAGSEKPMDVVTPEAPKLSSRIPVSATALAGYELGGKSPAGNRYAGSLRLLWQANQSIAVGMQPAFRFGNMPMVALTDARLYHTSDIAIDSYRTVEQSPSVRTFDTIYNYRIRETFDSIFVKGTSVGGNYWEVELPLIVHCKLNNSWYVYGGPSVNFGGKLAYQASGDPVKKTSVRNDFLAQSEQLPRAAFNNYFGKSTLEAYSSYQPAEAPQDPAAARLGYVAGVGYSWKKVMGEVSIHQQLSGYKAVAAPLKDFYATPHIRLSLGYLLFAPKANKSNAK